MYIRKIASWSSHSYQSINWLKPSHLLVLLWCMAIDGYRTRRKPVTTNGWLQTNKKFATRCKVSQVERKSPQMGDTHDNSSMLMLYLLFYAWAMVYSVFISLVFMIKELSHQAPHDISHKQSEFSDYYLVYYPSIILH